MSPEAHGAARRQTGFSLFAGGAYDPAAGGGRVAWQRPSGVALVARSGGNVAVPGTHPALAGSRIAWIDGDGTVLADAATFRDRDRLATPGAGVIALSDRVLAWRARDPAGTDRLWARALAGGEPRLLLESPAPTEIGRPALLGGTVLCHVAGPAGSRVIAIDAATGAQQLLRAEPIATLTNPSTDGVRLLYVRATGRQQELRMGPGRPRPPDRRPRAARLPVLRAGATSSTSTAATGTARATAAGARGSRPAPRPGVVATLWSTALTADAAYVTRLRVVSGGARSADILRVAALP